MAFFPLIERTGEVKFYFFKSLPYYPRLYLIGGLFALGFGLQVALLKVFPGLAFIIGALLMGLASGYDSTTELGRGSPLWKEVEWDAFEEVTKTSERAGRWDRTWLDITNARGAFLFIVVVAHALAVYFLLSMHMLRIVNIYVADVLSLALLVWCTGIRRILVEDQLVVKVEEFFTVKKKFGALLRKNGDLLVPMMETAPARGGKKEMPTDLQVRVHFKDMHPDFYGLTGQVVINDVQGTSYPYFYCVLVAKKGTIDWTRFRKPPANRKILVEFESQRDVDVLIIRQRTTKKSGYHVEPRELSTIFRTAYQRGRGINEALRGRAAA